MTLQGYRVPSPLADKEKEDLPISLSDILYWMAGELKASCVCCDLAAVRRGFDQAKSLNRPMEHGYTGVALAPDGERHRVPPVGQADVGQRRTTSGHKSEIALAAAGQAIGDAHPPRPLLWLVYRGFDPTDLQAGVLLDELR